MDPTLVTRIAALAVVLACAETLHGIARTVWVVPRIGKERAIKLSALTGSALAFGICFFLVPPMGLSAPLHLLALGGFLALFMAGFDVAVGRWLMHKAWHKIWPDFKPATGNYLLFGLVFLCVTPLLVVRITADLG
ncbi:MAG: hypothetical protein Q8S02_19010 [Hydrogenophaga sp.]|nr:hypothetical protein [Hydrogenophaga sp.]